MAPSSRYIFRPLLALKPEEVRIVFLGETPIHYRPLREQDGFAYSSATAIDGSLLNLSWLQQKLFRELLADQPIAYPKHGSLLKWVHQGILLWNWIPTVSQGQSGSHRGWGWDKLSKEIVETLYLTNPDVIFVPWGVPPQQWQGLLPPESLCITTKGPSLDGAGFGGTRPFSRINRMIHEYQLGKEINWNVNY